MFAIGSTLHLSDKFILEVVMVVDYLEASPPYVTGAMGRGPGELGRVRRAS